jgi:hypothetical protein
MFYRVRLRNGTCHENLTYDETLPLLREGEWLRVEFMDYGSDCSEDNKVLRENTYGRKPGML